MKTIHQILRDRLKVPIKDEPRLTPDDLAVQWDSNFERLMRNRLMMGGLRYGLLSSQRGSNYDSTGSAISRIKLYQKTGNTEHLVDVANLMLVEFKIGKHPKKHFKAQDDGVHTKEI